jgi:hypothetical protein
MKRLLVLTMVLGFVALAGRAAHAVNLLANPDLDTVAVSTQVNATPVSWTALSSKSVSGAFNDGLDSEGFANVLQAGGMGVFFKPFQGNLANPNATPPLAANLVSASLSQDVAGTAGAKYTLTGWAGAEANYVGLSDPSVKSQFVLQFLNGANSVLGSSTLDLNTVGLGVSGLPAPFGYNTYSVSGTAPAGTVVVRSIAQMLNAYANPLGGGQAFVVDSFNLAKVVPEPASIVLGMIAAAGMFGLVRRRS